MTNPTNEHREQARHRRYDHADDQRLQEMLDSLPDCPTEEEAEAVLQARGTSGKEVVNEFIERLLRERLMFEDGIKNFICDRGRHEGEHVFNLTVCSKCNESYIRAEKVLDTLVSRALVAPVSALSSRDAEVRELLRHVLACAGSPDDCETCKEADVVANG